MSDIDPEDGPPERVRFLAAKDVEIAARHYEIGESYNPDTDIIHLEIAKGLVVYGTRWEIQEMWSRGADKTDLLAQAAITDRVVMGIGPHWQNGGKNEVVEALKVLTDTVAEMNATLQSMRQIRNAGIDGEQGLVGESAKRKAELAENYDDTTSRMVEETVEDAVAVLGERVQEILGTPLEEVLDQLKGTGNSGGIRYDGPMGNSWGRGSNERGLDGPDEDKGLK